MTDDWKMDEKTPMMASAIELQIDKWFMEGIDQAHLDTQTGENNADSYEPGTSARLWFGRGYTYHWRLARLSNYE